MQISNAGFDFEIGTEDLANIRTALRSWKADPNIALNFDGSSLYDHFQCWEQFVDTNWEGWDISEYMHDIGCRAWIQLAIENSTTETAALLEQKVKTIDARFKNKMKPFQERWISFYLKEPFKNGPYFWETHTIHAEYCEQ